MQQNTPTEPTGLPAFLVTLGLFGLAVALASYIIGTIPYVGLKPEDVVLAGVFVGVAIVIAANFGRRPYEPRWRTRTAATERGRDD